MQYEWTVNRFKLLELIIENTSKPKCIWRWIIVNRVPWKKEAFDITWFRARVSKSFQTINSFKKWEFKWAEWGSQSKVKSDQRLEFAIRASRYRWYC